MLIFGGRQIETVAIVDDDPTSRESLAMCVNDSAVNSYQLGGPLGGIEAAYQVIESKAQGCICDHQLQTRGAYAGFSGAELAAWNNQHDLPSILCTRFIGTDPQMPVIRGYLKYLPVLCRPDQLEEPEHIIKALEACASELSGSFTPERRSWRTQIVVEQLDIDDRTVLVSLPAWQVDDPVRVRWDDVPCSLRDRIRIGFWTFVRANIGATQPELLYIDWPTE